MKKILALVLISLFISTMAYAVIKDTETMVNPTSAFYTGTCTMDVGATACKALSADSYEVRWVTMVVLPTNTGNVFIGRATTTTSQDCFTMSRDATGVDSITLPINDVNKIFMKSQRIADGVSWIAPKLF